MVKTSMMKLRDLNDDLSWFIIKAITKCAKREGKDFFLNVEGWDENLGNDMDIKMSINGIDVDFIACWKDYEEAWRIGVIKKAKEMITDKMWDVFDGISDKANILEKYLNEKIDEMFPDLEK